MNQVIEEIANKKRQKQDEEDFKIKLQNWLLKYPILKDCIIEFEQKGNIQDRSSCEYCHCERNRQCYEYDTRYECDITIKKDSKLIVELGIVFEQEVDTSDDKVVFEEEEEFFHEQFIDWEFFNYDFTSLEKITNDFFNTFCTYKDLSIKNTSQEKL